MQYDPDREKGLYEKYFVERMADPEGKHDACDYFVLDLVHDPIARPALVAYVIEARIRGYQKLADDLELCLRLPVP